MNKDKVYISLNLKITTAIFVGLALAVFMYAFCGWFENYVTVKKFTSEAAVEENIGTVYESLERYIETKHVKATDREALSAWHKKQEYTYFYVYDNYQNYFDAGWWSNPNAEPSESDKSDSEANLSDNIKIGEGKRIDEENFQVDVKNRIVEFEDGKYYVFIDQYREQHWQQIMKLITIVLCFLTLLTTILVYNGRMLKRIILLASEVKRVSDGDWDFNIRARHNDELGELAEGVDNMRTALIEKHKNERAAWDANTQLITSMSHDVRTPLTSMIGYLDIIEGKKYETTEQLDKYVSSCREKAFQLKDLSDKLFQYFLVFGNNENSRELERYDASILFQQLLSEHCAEIISYGYCVDFQFAISEVDVMTDLSGARRLFDNIFSNIMKYADKKVPIGIFAETDPDGKEIKIKITNAIMENAKKVESTRIGLKTCEKICSDLKGYFNYDEQEHVFAANMGFPVAPPKEEPEHPDEEETAEV